MAGEYGKELLKLRTASTKQNRSATLGHAFADVIIESAHQKYNARGARLMVTACIKRLEERLSEIQPKKATPKYKKARYG